jgi:hypothetical protein
MLSDSSVQRLQQPILPKLAGSLSSIARLQIQVIRQGPSLTDASCIIVVFGCLRFVAFSVLILKKCQARFLIHHFRLQIQVTLLTD